jgi:UDP-2,4-diacetamido-2,4,6-trideoxy-beta-L-altropyranose hydrolase
MMAYRSNDMGVVFRADASVRLGMGHIRRCLELASQLSARGVPVIFVCTEGPGNMIDQIVARGVAAAPLYTEAEGPPELGAHGWEQDAQRTSAAIAATAFAAHWLVVDQYGLDARWERAMRTHACHIMAIDDLADRPHDCDVLLDQNLTNPRHARYAQLLPRGTRQLLGPQHALVGPEFLQRRAAVLARRRGQVERMLISMGGTDLSNDTGRALEGVARSRYAGLPLDVVIGAANPHRDALASRCAHLAECELHVQTTRMAELMARADLAITGAGSTTWERCALGLPALAVVQSEDQSAIAQAVADAGGHELLGRAADVQAGDYACALERMTPAMLLDMSAAAAALCDGRGAERVASVLMNWSDG